MENHGAIYCIGRNYLEHAKELGNEPTETPLVFLKTPSNIRSLSSGPLAFANEEFHHEAEIILELKNDLELQTKGSIQSLSGLRLGLDLTRRKIQDQLKQKGQPWTLAKSFAGSALVSELIPLSSLSQIHFDQLGIRFYLNGEQKQCGYIKQMMFSVEYILTYLSTFQLLKKGDLIFTGTPSGVGPIKKGDKFTLELLQDQKTLKSFQGEL